MIKDYWAKFRGRLFWGSMMLSTGCSMTSTMPSSLPVAAPAKAASSAVHAEINRVLAAAPAQSLTPQRSYLLGPEDLIRITIFNIPEGEGLKAVTPRMMETRVSHQGSITLPLVNEVSVQGLTISEAEQRLKELFDKYIQNPQIGVLVSEYRSQRVAVVGSVLNPGVFELTGPKTVIDLLAKAGGLSGNASNQIHLYRDNPQGRESYIIDLLTVTKGIGSDVVALNLPVQAGDVVTVPEAGSFFVDGAVGKPGSYALTRPYTVTQALVAAGGVNRELAKTSGITLFRNRGSAGVEKVPIDLDDLVNGRQPDIQVTAEDVIVVPISAPKYVVRRFLGVLISGFSMERLVMY